MNKMICSMIVTLASVSTFAAPKSASVETQEVVQALLSRNGANAVAEFSQFADTVENVKIDKRKAATKITISGVKLMGGDIVCGFGELVVIKTMATPFGAPPYVKAPVYSAEVSGEANCK